MTLIRMPLHYQVRAKPYRHKGEREITLVDFVQLDVRDVPREEAVEGAVVETAGASATLLWWDGRYWLPDRVADAGEMALRGVLDMKTRADADRESYFLLRHLRAARAYVSQGGLFPDAPVTVETVKCRDVSASFRNEAHDSLVSAAGSQLAFIGSELHVAVPAPCPFVSIMKNGGGFRTPPSVALSCCLGDPLKLLENRQQYPHEMKVFPFPADRWDEAAEFASWMAAEAGAELDRQVELRHVHGDSPQPDTERDELRAASWSYLHSSFSGIRDLPKDEALKWFGFRDACRPLGRRHEEGTDADLDAAFARMEDLAEAVPPAVWERAAMMRWRDRPLDLGLDMPAPGF